MTAPGGPNAPLPDDQLFALRDGPRLVVCVRADGRVEYGAGFDLRSAFEYLARELATARAEHAAPPSADATRAAELADALDQQSDRITQQQPDADLGDPDGCVRVDLQECAGKLTEAAALLRRWPSPPDRERLDHASWLRVAEVLSREMHPTDPGPCPACGALADAVLAALRGSGT